MGEVFLPDDVEIVLNISQGVASNADKMVLHNCVAGRFCLRSTNHMIMESTKVETNGLDLPVYG